MKNATYFVLCTLLAAFALGIAPDISMAQDVAPSYKESPDVYKMISENEHFRVILATWKPGQRDKWHSHAGPSTIYRLTDCNMRAHTPDGKVVDRPVAKRGSVGHNPTVTSHSLENVGTTDCQLLIVEKK
ncbi:MAG: cupin domain-containing protein [Thermodesulfovibrionales bacterium]